MHHPRAGKDNGLPRRIRRARLKGRWKRCDWLVRQHRDRWERFMDVLAAEREGFAG